VDTRRIRNGGILLGLLVLGLGLGLVLLASTTTPASASSGISHHSSHASTTYINQHGMYAIFSGVWFFYSENANRALYVQVLGINYETVVTHANWAGVVPYGLQWPASFTVYASLWVIDAYGSWWTAPNNYPYCFVGAQDAYACGDTQSINHLVFNSGGLAWVRLGTSVATDDDYGDTWSWNDDNGLNSY